MNSPAANQTIHACGSLTDSAIPETLDQYLGICDCTTYPRKDMKEMLGPKIAKSLFDNRIRPDVFWRLMVPLIVLFCPLCA